MLADGAALIHGSAHRTYAGHSPADPTRIWTALTDPAETPDYLYGLALRSTWTANGPIDVQHSGDPALIGRVLCSHPNERLSYLLQASAADPPIYLTWLIRAGRDGCTIYLEIDCAESEADSEDTWLPVLARLQKLLDPG
jgi:uncharacterized protein YndB with AHSA1/START domain